MEPLDRYLDQVDQDNEELKKNHPWFPWINEPDDNGWNDNNLDDNEEEFDNYISGDDYEEDE